MLNTVSGKNSTLLRKKRTRFLNPNFLLFLLFIIGIYLMIVRPYLIPSMATVPVELFFEGIILLAEILTLVTFLLTIVFTLLVALISRNKTKLRPWKIRLQKQLIFTIILTLVFTIVVLGSQKLAYTPAIRDKNGDTVEGSIAQLQKVPLNNSDQWISIRGENRDNPVLLYLAGGPGGTQLAATRKKLHDLEKDFVVVNWEQPGAGKSYHAVPLKSLTPERYIEDALKLTQYLRKEFHQDKIYLIGDSWGSALGIWMVQQEPTLFHAFIGTGQMVSFTKTEKICYETALNIAKEKSDKKKVEELTRQGPPPYYGDDMVWKEFNYLMYLSSYMSSNPEINNRGYDTPGDLAGPEYGLYDKLNFVRGTLSTFNDVYQQLYDFDLRKQATTLEVPIYFFLGRHDLNAPPKLAEDYFEKIQAPHKELIWFEHSGHNPWMNETGKFVEHVKFVRKKTESVDTSFILATDKVY